MGTEAIASSLRLELRTGEWALGDILPLSDRGPRIETVEEHPNSWSDETPAARRLRSSISFSPCDSMSSLVIATRQISTLSPCRRSESFV